MAKGDRVREWPGCGSVLLKRVEKIADEIRCFLRYNDVLLLLFKKVLWSFD